MKASGYARVPNDWYVEPADCVDALIRAEDFTGAVVWDPACGGGNIPRRFDAAGIVSCGSDLVDRGFGRSPVNFLKSKRLFDATVIVSNPPFGIIEEFVEHGLDLPGIERVIVLARLAFLEGQARAKFFEVCPLMRLWVSRPRISMPPGGTDIPARGGTVAYGWFVFSRAHLMPYEFSGGWLR